MIFNSFSQAGTILRNRATQYQQFRWLLEELCGAADAAAKAACLSAVTACVGHSGARGTAKGRRLQLCIAHLLLLHNGLVGVRFPGPARLHGKLVGVRLLLMLLLLLQVHLLHVGLRHEGLLGMLRNMQPVMPLEHVLPLHDRLIDVLSLGLVRLHGRLGEMAVRLLLLLVIEKSKLAAGHDSGLHQAHRLWDYGRSPAGPEPVLLKAVCWVGDLLYIPLPCSRALGRTA
jgi:hypothetical protein